MVIVVCGYRGGLGFDIVHNVEEEVVNRSRLWVVRNVVLVEDKGVGGTGWTRE